ncbi:cystathionine beta synthase [Piedraia hortae CBS 480.64]|uniref:Cystathionine beta-synthase n=1 Tax=Piedraia hortae CBS 480.64 TaxID=1314780 RepID=A0A6A7C9V9_9PEZI|nr:cystathionine beta synthase [Piedraia hortae CBS 480.64]
MAHLTSPPGPPPAVMSSILEQIGNTPLVQLSHLAARYKLPCKLYAKCEFFNSGGSVKDRIALRMIEDAERRGKLKPNHSVLIEPTSGNTGIGLALVGAVKGYRTIITLPEKMSAEKVAVLKSLGAEIIRTPTSAAWDSPESHIGVARRLEKEIPGGIVLDQYKNENNPLAHEFGTAVELLSQMKAVEGRFAAVIAGAGTGGTITGLSRGLRKQDKSIKVIAADPEGSILAVPPSLNTATEGRAYQVEGIGYDFVPDVLVQNEVDKWYKTDDRDSFLWARRLIREEGLLVGGSSGAAMSACMQYLAESKDLTPDDAVVVILPDSIRSYLSKFVDDDWLAAHDLDEPQQRPKETPITDQKPNQTPPLRKAKIKDLRLKPIRTVTATATVSEAVEIMRDKGFDQIPVTSPPNEGSSHQLAGMITLGNCLSYLASGKITSQSLVKDVMFNFAPLQKSSQEAEAIVRAREMDGDEFIEMTTETSLEDLERFFVWNAAAVITERVGEGENAQLKPVAVATKVDLLTWMLKHSKV